MLGNRLSGVSKHEADPSCPFSSLLSIVDVGDSFHLPILLQSSFYDRLCSTTILRVLQPWILCSLPMAQPHLLLLFGMRQYFDCAIVTNPSSSILSILLSIYLLVALFGGGGGTWMRVQDRGFPYAFGAQNHTVIWAPNCTTTIHLLVLQNISICVMLLPLRFR